jgi:hypothetical protein
VLAVVTLLLQHNLDITWFRIAVDHERAALEARGQLDTANARSEDVGRHIDDEMRAAMVAIAAAAFSIEAMLVKVEDLVDVDKRPPVRDSRDRKVETFKAALQLDGGRAHRWQHAIPALFKLRREMVHYRGKATEGLPHPTVAANVSDQASTYTSEEASMSVDLALDVLTTAHRSPRRCHAALVELAERDAHIPAYLEAVRGGEAT